jgi:hypothetical protein
LHTATADAFASADGFCGRKKLPFAGYSVVKEPELTVVDAAVRANRNF